MNWLVPWGMCLAIGFICRCKEFEAGREGNPPGVYWWNQMGNIAFAASVQVTFYV